jgi:hypothetical protein
MAILSRPAKVAAAAVIFLLVVYQFVNDARYESIMSSSANMVYQFVNVARYESIMSSSANDPFTTSIILKNETDPNPGIKIDNSTPLHSAATSLEVVTTTIDPDRTATLVSDISSISHDPSKGLIKVHLKKDRKCLRPAFRGRLSGPYLAILSWDAHALNNGDTAEAELIGRYQVPAPGKYHLEIIALVCNEDVYKSDFRRTCLENPDHHRITAKTAQIMITQVHESYNDTVGLGSWHHADKDSILEESHQEQQERLGVPLFTRYQPTNYCRGENATTLSKCIDAMNMERFKPYQFKWNNKTEQALASLQNVVGQRQHEKLCFVGWSHTRHLMNFRQHSLALYNLHQKVTFEWRKAHNVRGTDEAFIAKMFADNCTQVLFGLGQWDGSAFTSFDNWKSGVASVIAHAKSYNQARKPGDQVGIFITAAHYNPLGDAKTTCPPGDGRSPTVIDEYNTISKLVCAEENVTFIDTNSAVIGPVWDMAADWCHYASKC